MGDVSTQLPTPQHVPAIAGFQIRKRDGRIVPFEGNLILNAISAAFRADSGMAHSEPLPEEVTTKVQDILDAVVREVQLMAATGQTVDVERIQDQVEMELMRAGEFQVARRYIVYREERSRARAVRLEQAQAKPKVQVTGGETATLDALLVKQRVFEACQDLEDARPEEMLEEIFASLYDGITYREIDKAMIMAARARIERDPAYDQVASRLLRNVVYDEVFGELPDAAQLDEKYRHCFEGALRLGVEQERYDPELLNFDLDRLAAALHPERDASFTYLGMQTLYDRYLIHVDQRRIEAPQHFWMRVAMGLAVNEQDREARAIEFYEVLSTRRFVSATPTLFNSGTLHPQLSSCYLSTVEDDLSHIFKVIGDNAALSKWAGGLGNDWTNVRATGAYIHGTNGASQGVIPFLKIVNDTAIAVNQGGKRKGAVCSYLETWHLDIEDFLELRKNTGDDRRRTHDMHTANWIPDLFMKRVREHGKWTLFSPQEAPDLHQIYGEEFERRYLEYERKAQAGEIKQSRQVDALELWRKMLSMVFETGHPWMTYKDPSNLRSPQDHVGVIHNSNLCTEILLNTDREETAVCNLGSLNLREHTGADGLDQETLANTVRTAVRMLDNVIDINFYPTQEAKNANMRHRPVGLGLMGTSDALLIQRIPYNSDEAVSFADQSMEFISYHAIQASAELAAERGHYPTYPGSKWDRGMLPIDTLELMRQQRGAQYFDVDGTCSMDWAPLREVVRAHGMRNSNVMAIAPTATISNIAGCSQSIEPNYRNLFVKSNLSGDFTIANPFLVTDLKRLGVWDDQMIDDLKYFDGSVQQIERIPDDLKLLYRTAFEVEPAFLIEATSRRQKWIDMGISFNLYIDEPSGKKLNDMYFKTWEKGLKTTYYLRSQAATQIEKSSMDVNRRGFQPRWMKSQSASGRLSAQTEGAEQHGDPAAESMPETVTRACSIDDPDCEACQ